MKKSVLILGVLVLTVGCLSTSCTKEKLEKQEVRTEIKSDQFETDLLYYMSMLNERSHIRVQNEKGEFQTNIVAEEVRPTLRAIVCEGSGISFARCVQQWLGDHPGRCLKIYKDDGTYYADDDC